MATNDTPFQYTPTPNFDYMRQQALGAYNSAVDSLQQKQRDLAGSSGYTYSTDGGGNVTLGGLDVHNAHGAVQQMYGQQGDQLLHDQYGAASRGLGQYGHNNQQSTRYGQAAQRTDYGRQLLGNLNDYHSQIANAVQGYNASMNDVASQQTDFNAQQQSANAATDAQAAASQQQNDAIMQLLNQYLGKSNVPSNNGFGHFVP